MNFAALDLNLGRPIDAALRSRQMPPAAMLSGWSQPASSHAAAAACARYSGLSAIPLVRVGARMEPDAAGAGLRGPLAHVLDQVPGSVLIPDDSMRTTRNAFFRLIGLNLACSFWCLAPMRSYAARPNVQLDSVPVL